MTDNDPNGIVKRAASGAAQWAAAGLLAVMVLPVALALTLVIALSDIPPDFDES